MASYRTVMHYSWAVLQVRVSLSSEKKNKEHMLFTENLSSIIPLSVSPKALSEAVLDTDVSEVVCIHVGATKSILNLPLHGHRCYILRNMDWKCNSTK